MIRPALYAGAALLLAATASCAQDKPHGMSRGEVETIVREYILENPEIIEEAIIALSLKQQAEKVETARAAISENAEALIADARDYSIGPADAELTIVDFFDYRCPYCKASNEWVQTAPERHGGKVRVVFKEFPILSAESEQAALAALAAGKQGKYVEMHSALMESRGAFKKSDIDAIAEETGVDVAKMREDMESDELQDHVAAVRELAHTIGADATPTFVINGQLMSGYDPARLETMIEEALGQPATQ